MVRSQKISIWCRQNCLFTWLVLCWNCKTKFQNHNLGTKMQLSSRLIKKSVVAEHAFQKIVDVTPSSLMKPLFYRPLQIITQDYMVKSWRSTNMQTTSTRKMNPYDLTDYSVPLSSRHETSNLRYWASGHVLSMRTQKWPEMGPP